MNFAKIIDAGAQKLQLDPSKFSQELKIAEAKFGDWQLNGALGYAKQMGMNPREVAQKLVEAIETLIDKEKIKVTIAGPGFINFTFTPVALIEQIKEFSDSGKLSPMTRVGERIVLDFGSPNVGKQPHIGHLRSYNIGEALNRLMRFCGAHVHRDNHLGDWGTTFGYIIYAIKKTGATLDDNDPAKDIIDTIENLYRMANDEAKTNPAVTEAARAEVAKLQSGDPENTALWKKIVAANWKGLEKFQESFGIHYDSVLGESFYNDKVERVYRELTDTGLAKIDDGALVVFHPEHPRFKEQPFIIRKSDGAANYGSSDLATMLYRVQELKAQKIYIVVDHRQSDHFEQLWLTTKKWFVAKGYPTPEFEHVAFGMVLGEDGRPLKTRSGSTVKLKDLLAEAVERARKVVDEKSPELGEAQRKEIAEIVGIGAVRYADLAQNRTSDYQFSWDKLLSFEGNTAPYLLYAVARIHTLFEKLGRKSDENFSNVTTLETPAEIALARKLIQTPYWVALAAADLRPHYLCTYLYELAGAFSAFYNSDHIQGQPAGIQNRRLLLAQKTLLVLETGLSLLGLKTVKRM